MRNGKLSRLYVAQPGAHVNGTYTTLFQAEHGWDLTIRPDVQGVIAKKDDLEVWVPFAACRNGFMLPESEQKSTKAA
jgi:hypothetical protein